MSQNYTSTIQQDLGDLIPGHSYELSFYLSVPVYDDPAQTALQFTIGDYRQQIPFEAVMDNWSQFKYVYNATTTTATLEFQLLARGDITNDPNLNVHVGLDLVTLTDRSAACLAPTTSQGGKREVSATNPLLERELPVTPVRRAVPISA